MSYAGSPGIEVEMNLENIPNFVQTLRALGKDVSDTKTVRRMLRPGVTPIRREIRKRTPKGKRIHVYYYRKKRGATFKPGHLKKSIQDISTRKRGYKNIAVLWVGPVYTGKAGQGGVLGGSVQNVDAYYAHMALGNKQNFIRQVIETGFSAAKAEATARIVKKMDQEFEKAMRKRGLK